MSERCPILHAYLKAIDTHVNFHLAVNESYYTHLEELFELADTAGSSVERQHQRAFFCIELMCSRIAPKIPVAGASPFMLLSWPRSREGLNRLLEALRADVEDLVGASVEFAFEARDSVSVDNLINDNRSRLVEVGKASHESIVLLRRAMKNRDVVLQSIGTKLAWATQTARMSVPDLFMMARELIEQTERSAVRAWELKKT